MLEAVWPELESIRCLQPALDESDRAKGPAGWSQVKAWCEALADDLHDVLDPDLGDRIDLLVVAIDVAFRGVSANGRRSARTSLVAACGSSTCARRKLSVCSGVTKCVSRSAARSAASRSRTAPASAAKTSSPGGKNPANAPGAVATNLSALRAPIRGRRTARAPSAAKG